MSTDPALPQTQRMGAYGICINEGGEILLSRYAPPEATWSLPGGGVEHGEHPEDAVVRELREETGYLVSVDRLLKVESEVWDLPDVLVHSVNFIFLTSVIGGELTFEVEGSSDRAAWVPLSQVPELERKVFLDRALAYLG